MDGGRDLGERGDGEGIRSEEGQERWPDGHENEWKFSADGDGEVGYISRIRVSGVDLSSDSEH